MEKITGNEPMHMATSDSGHVGQMPGLTIRQHFAGLAMQGLLSVVGGLRYDHIQRAAEISVKQADALIEALNKPKQ